MSDFFNMYGPNIIGILMLAIFGAIGLLLGRFLNTEAKQIIAKNAMLFVEQTIKDLHGEDKMALALAEAANLLAKKHIKFDADEMRTLIEAALAEFKRNLNKSSNSNTIME